MGTPVFLMEPRIEHPSYLSGGMGRGKEAPDLLTELTRNIASSVEVGRDEKCWPPASLCELYPYLGVEGRGSPLFVHSCPEWMAGG